MSAPLPWRIDHVPRDELRPPFDFMGVVVGERPYDVAGR